MYYFDKRGIMRVVFRIIYRIWKHVMMSFAKMNIWKYYGQEHER